MTFLDSMGKLSVHEQKVLSENQFDEDIFESLYSRYRQGELSPEKNRIRAAVEVPAADELLPLGTRHSERGKELIHLGKQALERGEVGVVILNGGMATRFGGLVKGCVDVIDNHSFLGLKLLDVKRHSANASVLLMNSFATDEQTRRHLEEHDFFGIHPEQILSFRQNISIRLTPGGEFFRDENGRLSFYAPGHGDLAEALNRGTLQAFQQRGGKYLLMSNVDNILATLDPLVIGTHIDAVHEKGVQMSVETVRKNPGDVGGMPARVDGHLQVVEAFRFPEAFELDSIPVFNTNTFVFNADALSSPPELTWFVVRKHVNDYEVVQFERLAGELSAFLKTQFLIVDRSGEHSRFLPIKSREDLEANREIFRCFVNS